MVAYAVIHSKAPLKASKCKAVLKGKLLGAKQKFKVPFVLDSSAAAPSLPVVHHLAAKALITDWETEEKEKKSIVDLSIESSVISSHTAFIAIDEESSEPVSGSMKTYDLQAEMCSSGSSGSYHGVLYGCSEVLEDFDDTILESGAAPPPPLPSRARNLRGMSNDAESEEEDAIPVPKPRNAAPKPRNAAKVDKSCEAELEYELESWSEGEGQERVLKQRMEKEAQQAASDEKAGLKNLTKLITAQQLDGSWELTSSFAQLIGKPLSDLEAACPIGREGVGAAVWATVLAVSLLRSRYSSQQDEWELIAMKAESWLKKQSLPPGTTLEKFFQDAQKQLQ